MKRFFILSLCLCLLLFSACSAPVVDGEGAVSPSAPAQSPSGTPSPPVTPDSAPDTSPPSPDKSEMERAVHPMDDPKMITQTFSDAIRLFVERLTFDFGSLLLSVDDADMALHNAYFDALAQDPLLKYAYDLDIFPSKNSGLLECTLRYMPYKTGTVDTANLPDGTHRVDTLQDLIEAAQKTRGPERATIAIANSALEVEDMQRALMQSGGGFVVFTLNEDATEILALPSDGRTLSACVADWEQTESLADTLLAKIITSTMTDDEKINTIYAWVTANVTYDERYYNGTMPYISRTALGALRDGTAICGGFSWAFKTLLNRAGIPCYNIEGTSFGDYHMWNLAPYENRYCAFDTTFDRGLVGNYLEFARLDRNFYLYHSTDEDYITRLVGTTLDQQ